MTMILEITSFLCIIWISALAIYLKPIYAIIRARQGK